MFPCYAEGTLPLCHFGPLYTLALRCAFALSRAKSNYSRTSAPFSRKSNHSRTYARQGGVGECLCYRYGNVSKICRRADNFVQSREKEPISQNQPHPSHVADCFPEPSRWGHALTASGKPAPSLHIP